jgi:hypothetical protein
VHPASLGKILPFAALKVDCCHHQLDIGSFLLLGLKVLEPLWSLFRILLPAILLLMALLVAVWALFVRLASLLLGTVSPLPR